MVIGGQAVLRHGEARLTKDIDLTLGVDVDRLADVLGVARDCSLEVLVDPSTFVAQTMVLPCRDPESGIRVDLVFSHSSYEREAVGRAESVRLGASDVRFATVEDLIIHKMVAGRARDLEDVRGILLKNPDARHTQIEAVLLEFGRAMDEPFVERFQEILKAIRP
jgi:hypothetical protein